MTTVDVVCRVVQECDSRQRRGLLVRRSLQDQPGFESVGRTLLTATKKMWFDSTWDSNVAEGGRRSLKALEMETTTAMMRGMVGGCTWFICPTWASQCTPGRQEGCLARLGDFQPKPAAATPQRVQVIPGIGEHVHLKRCVFAPNQVW